jgi:hypothetical protein
MSNSLCKEYLLDYAVGKLSIDEIADIDLAVETVLTSTAIKDIEMKMLYAYLYGYTDAEVAQIFHIDCAEVAPILTRVVDAIGATLHMDDSQLVYHARISGYPASKMKSFEWFLREHGKVYAAHIVPNMYGVSVARS